MSQERDTRDPRSIERDDGLEEWLLVQVSTITGKKIVGLIHETAVQYMDHVASEIIDPVVVLPERNERGQTTGRAMFVPLEMMGETFGEDSIYIHPQGIEYSGVVSDPGIIKAHEEAIQNFREERAKGDSKIMLPDDGILKAEQVVQPNRLK